MTDIFALNDPSEVVHGLNAVMTALKQAAEKRTPFHRDLTEWCGWLSRDENLRQTASYFVASFSSRRDDLCQWRTYGNNGKGYCLGFDGRALEGAFCDEQVDGGNSSTFPITYDSLRLASLIDGIVAVLLPRFSVIDRDITEKTDLANYYRALRLSFSLEALTNALFFKHEAYGYESEYRFLQVFKANAMAPDVEGRQKHGRTVNYREFHWQRLTQRALKEVIVGPSSQQDAEARVRKYLRSKSLAKVQVSRSDIPFRS